MPQIIKEGKFQAQVQVYLCNDGPVTLILDSRGI
ncbi:MAG: D-aminoacyl-tRNA deacylase [Armatimonadetes bacterium]|nr:D-aminoacyl-tRNA deacylase [Armatimonadota bacterium]